VRAIWSFWSIPFAASRHAAWASPRHHLLSWVLSVQQARQHYPETVLVTDESGKALLAEDLNLPFTTVDTRLNPLSGSDPRWWALGKLHAYASQSQPFVHIDSDVYLWKPLPQRCVAASVFAQNPESFEFGQGWYRPDRWNVALTAVHGWAPPEAACCGIFGGRDTAFIAHYARSAIRMIEHRRNRLAWQVLGTGTECNVLAEQYFLSACLHYHSNHVRSMFSGVEMQYLFPSADAAFDPTEAERMGYTHLIAGAKRDPVLAGRLERRVQRDYPASYDRVMRCCERRGWM
jgi:hypothetical protein